MNSPLTTALLLTLEVAALATAVLLVVGTPLAWLMAFRSFRGKWVVESLFLLPVTLPPTVLGFYLLLLFAPGGPWQRLTGLQWAFRLEGLVAASVLFNLPFALTTYREAFLALDPDVVQTARTLGARAAKLWWEVILPLTWPGLLSGSLLAFAHTIGEFGVLLMVGGNIPGRTQTVSIYLYDLVQALEFGRAHEVALVLLALSLTLLGTARLLEARWRAWRSAMSSRGP